jgi:sugar/nucleoside kinase (ribokinase family)
MPKILVAGEALVEIMRPGLDLPLDAPGPFEGPFPSGAPAIAADAVSRLGGWAGFIGAVGDDDFGRCVIRRLEADGVDVRFLRRVSDATTAMAFVTYFRDGSRRFLFHLRQSAATAMDTDQVDNGYLADVAYLHLSGSTLAMSERLRQTCLALADRVLSTGGRLSFDPNFRPELLPAEEARKAYRPFVERASVLLPSGQEACWLAAQGDPTVACRTLLEMGPSLVVLKQGTGGATAFSRERTIHVPGYAVEEVDPTGAGDCFAAGLLTALVEGLDLETALRLANGARALAVTRRGPMEGTPTRQALEEFLARAPVREQTGRRQHS